MNVNFLAKKQLLFFASLVKEYRQRCCLEADTKTKEDKIVEWILVLVILVQLCLFIKRICIFDDTPTAQLWARQKEQIMAAVVADLERITPKQ